MSHHHPPREQLDPKLQERIAKVERRDHWVDHVFRRILHVLERIIAIITLLERAESGERKLKQFEIHTSCLTSFLCPPRLCNVSLIFHMMTTKSNHVTSRC